MPEPSSPLSALVERVFPRLRYPYLFAVLAALLLVDLVIPDPIPVLDETLLALLTFLAAAWRTRREPAPPPDTTPALPDAGNSPPTTDDAGNSPE
jgi:hypothetical protein